MNKGIHTDKAGIQYSTRTRFIIRRITSDGLIKPFEGTWGTTYEWPYNTKEEAIEEVAKHELHNAIILERIEIDYIR